MNVPKQIVLTSFRDRFTWNGVQFSVARWNPAGAKEVPKVKWLSPTWDGKPAKRFSSNEYRLMYERILEKESSTMVRFLYNYANYNLVLLCWCNPDRQKRSDKLFCHRILIGYYIEKHFPEIEVIYADGANNPIWEREEKLNVSEEVAQGRIL